MSAVATLETVSDIDPIAEDFETRSQALRDAWMKGDSAESTAAAALIAALNDRGAARVVKARVAYMAGVLGSKTDVPTAAGAVRVLGVAKTTLQPYWKTGQALSKAGLVGSILAPTPAEIEIAASVFDPVNASNAATKGNASKGKPADAPAGGTEGGTEGGTGVGTPTPSTDPTTQADVIQAVEDLQNILSRFTREQGFSGVVAMNLTAALEEIITTIDTFTVDGGDA